MRHNLGSRLWKLVVLFVALGVVSPAAAQDDDTESDRQVHFLIEIDAWGAQPVGLEYEPATELDPSGTFGDEIIDFSHDTSTDPYYKVALDAGDNVGAFRASWFKQTQEEFMQEFQPGSFLYGELLAHPLGAGYLNDGRSDGFEASTKTQITDLRFDYMRTAFRTDRVEGRWLVGIRRVLHERNLDTVYYALAPLQPPLIPPVSDPRPDLDPLPDEARISSDYRGRGLEAGMEFDFALVKNRIKLASGFAVAVLRGRMDTNYFSRNWVYLFTDPLDGSQYIIPPPYDFTPLLPDGSTVADNTTQVFSDFGLRSNSRQSTNPVMDLYLELRGRVWKGLEVVAGFRSVYYGNVGVDLRQKVATLSNAGISVVDVTETDRSAGYEGFYVGAAYTF